ncbi:MAG: ABC transporter substrate-binding protein [Candidatus Binatia bacterium]
MKIWLPPLLIAVLLASTADFARAQQTKNIPRIGYLGLNDPSSPLFGSFRQGLRELGYVEGQNIFVEPRFAFGNDWRLEQLAAELVQLKVSVIVTQSTLDLFAAKDMTKTIPIVMAYSGDPVAAGIINSRERPGTNITGISGFAAGLGGKWLELLKQTVPETTRVGVLYTRNSEQTVPLMKELEVAARSLRIELQPGDARGVAPGTRVWGPERNVGTAFTVATRGESDGFIVLPGFSFEQNADYIANLALQRRLPGIFSRAEFAEAGGLMAYGANQLEQFRRIAYVVDKILKGAKPAETPMEGPKKFELVINLKTAKEIGITVPPRVLAWADRVIK